jgi:4'-phosphopantetheinyl transferase
MHPPAPGLEQLAGQARHALAATGLVPPQAGQVSVVMFDTAAWCRFQQEACEWLGPAERARAQRFRFDRDRSVYVLAHALWRAVLAVALECEPCNVPLAFLPSGQPQLPGTALATSLSHSGSVALVAVGAVRMLGIDLEQGPPRIALDELSPAICTPREAAALHVLPPARRERALLQLWARKEALLKAFGTGLRQSPASFEAVVGEPVSPPAQGGPRCRVFDLALPSHCPAALAASADMVRYALHVPGVWTDRSSAGNQRPTPAKVVEV